MLVMVAVAFSLFAATAAGAMSIREENELGREFLKNIKRELDFVDDHIIIKTVNRIGRKLLSEAPESPFAFRFFVVRDPVANAFNAPGGLVFITSGLLAMIHDEDELAGVMAHEMGHGINRHVIKLLESQQKISLAAIGAIILGSLASKSANGAIATTALSIAAAQATTLKFSRENEKEADTVAIKLLIRAGYDPTGLARILERLEEARVSSGQTPKYLLTHPTSEERIGQIESIAHNLVGNKRPAISSPTREFDIFRTRCQVMSSNIDVVSHLFTERIKKGVADATDYFGLGLCYKMRREYVKAAENFFEACKIDPRNAEFIKELGITYFKWGKMNGALSTLKTAIEIDPEDTDAMFYLARTLWELEKWSDAARYFEKVEKALPEKDEVKYYLGVAYAKMGLACRSHKKLAEYYASIGDVKSEKFHMSKYNELKKERKCK